MAKLNMAHKNRKGKACLAKLSYNQRPFPAHFAAKYGHIQELRKLIKEGLDLELQDNTGATALMVASSGCQIKCMRALIDAGARVDGQDCRGYSVLMLALDQIDTRAHSGEPARMLIAAGAPVNMRSKKGVTALMLAVKKKDVESAKALVEAGSEVDAIREDGSTALSYAEFGAYEYIWGESEEEDAEVENEKGMACLAFIRAAVERVEIAKTSNVGEKDGDSSSTKRRL